MDRGMLSEANIRFLKEDNRRYLIGTPKSMLKQFERDLLKENWGTVRDEVEAKRCPCPDGSEETFILCRSRDRLEKEKAIFARFESRIEEGLTKIHASCQKRKYKPVTIAERVGRLNGANSRAARLFHVEVEERDNGGTKSHGRKTSPIVLGPHSPTVATFCAVMSIIGQARSDGKRTSN